MPYHQGIFYNNIVLCQPYSVFLSFRCGQILLFIHSNPPLTNPLQQYIFSNTGIIYDISYMFYLVDRIPVIITHKMPFFQSFFSTSFHVDHHMCHIFHPCVLRLFSLLRNSCVKRTGCLSKHCWNIANYTTMKQQDLFFFSTALNYLGSN